MYSSQLKVTEESEFNEAHNAACSATVNTSLYTTVIVQVPQVEGCILDIFFNFRFNLIAQQHDVTVSCTKTGGFS